MDKTMQTWLVHWAIYFPYLKMVIKRNTIKW